MNLKDCWPMFIIPFGLLLGVGGPLIFMALGLTMFHFMMFIIAVLLILFVIVLW